MNVPLWLSSSLVLDARKALWFPRERTLAVANLHLGWTPGEESPATDETVALLLALAADYQPERVVLLGELVHPRAPLPVTTERLRALLETLGERTGVVLLGDPADAAFDARLREAGWEAGVVPHWQCGKHLLLHGACDMEAGPAGAPREEGEEEEEGACRVIATENPGIILGEAAPVCCPCFLLAEGVLLLPAFSPWVTPLDFRRETWHTPALRDLEWKQAVAIAAGKLLPMGLPPPRSLD